MSLNLVEEKSSVSRKLRPFWKIGIVLFLFSVLGSGAILYYRFYVRNAVSTGTFVSTAESIDLLPWMSLEFNDATFFKDWNEHVFHEKSNYQIEFDEHGEAFLHVSSQAASSVLLRQVNISPSERPFLTWEWKVTQFPSNKKNQKLGAKSDNDFSMRVYAIFGGGLPFNSEVIQYVWDDHFPEGTFASGAFSAKTKIFVIQSGKTNSGSGWISEKRDLALDYRELFAKPLKGNLAVIGVMSDSDNTGTQSEAYLRRLEIQKPKDIALLAPSGFKAESQYGNPVAQLFGTVRSGVQNGVQNGIKASSKWFENLRNQVGKHIFGEERSL